MRQKAEMEKISPAIKGAHGKSRAVPGPAEDPGGTGRGWLRPEIPLLVSDSSGIRSILPMVLETGLFELRNDTGVIHENS